MYTGQQYDQEMGQYYLRARYYNPVEGRFTQEDVYRGDGLNLYAYCKNNPVTYYYYWHAEQKGERISQGQSGRVSASSGGASHGGVSCGPCNDALNAAGVYNVTGVQENAGGTGRNFPK